MLTLLRRLFSSTPPASRHAATSSRLDQAPPPDIDAGPGPALGLVQHMHFHGGFPYMDWPRLLPLPIHRLESFNRSELRELDFLHEAAQTRRLPHPGFAEN